MGAAETYTATVHIGDVIELGRPDTDSNTILWDEPSVVMDASRSHLGLSHIVEDNGEVFLTTIGTSWGIVRHVDDAERWTPTQAAIAMIEGMWWDYSEAERVANDFEVLLIIADSINKLRSSLVTRAENGPVVYSYTPKTTAN